MTTNINKSVHRPAIFISKQGAARGLITHAKEWGLTTAVVAREGCLTPKYNRGCLIGYTASVRLSGGVQYVEDN